MQFVNSKSLRDNRAFLLEVCAHNGLALKFVSKRLRADKQIVMASVAQDPDMLKYALNGLCQDKDCLVAAGIWDNHHHLNTVGKYLANCNGGSMIPEPEKIKIVLSTRFSLKEDSSSRATDLRYYSRVTSLSKMRIFLFTVQMRISNQRAIQIGLTTIFHAVVRIIRVRNSTI